MENLKQSTQLLDDLRPCIHIGDRGSDVYDDLLHRRSTPISSSFNRRRGSHDSGRNGNKIAIKGLHCIKLEITTAILTKAFLRLRLARDECYRRFFGITTLDRPAPDATNRRVRQLNQLVRSLCQRTLFFVSSSSPSITSCFPPRARNYSARSTESPQRLKSSTLNSVQARNVSDDFIHLSV